MSESIFPILFLFISIFLLMLSNSKANYKKLTENNGEKFAKKVNKLLKACGYLLLGCSLFWLTEIYFL